MGDRDDYAAPGRIESGGSFNDDVSPTVFTSTHHHHAGGQGHGNHRGGYSNLGLQLPATTCAGDGEDDNYDDDEEEVEAVAGGFVAAKMKAKTGGRRKNMMAYVGLGDGDDGTAELSSDSGGEEAREAADGDKASGRLAIFGLLNLGYVVLQLMGAMAFSSLALLSDGFHNLSDV